MSDFCVRSLIDQIVFHFTDTKSESSSLIKISSKDLAINGELYFHNSLVAWKKHVICDEDCISILQHFAHAHNVETDNTDEDIAKKVLDQLISKSSNWFIRVQRCTLQKEKVSVFLNRTDIIPNAIKLAIQCGVSFGKVPQCDKKYDVRYLVDLSSEITTQRIRLTQKMARRILNLNGYRLSRDQTLSDKDYVCKCIFTSNPKISFKGYRNYVCGVVKNSHFNKKETFLTWEHYTILRKDYLMDLNKFKMLEKHHTTSDSYWLSSNMANASLKFEIMSIKPSRSFLIEYTECDRDYTKVNESPKVSITNIKGAALFVLYNNARIATIIAKYNDKVSRGGYPSLPNIEDIDFSNLQEEEEWELIYNFILGYPQMLRDCVSFEPNFEFRPQMICQFLSRLCQKFSIYYRKTRILTEGGDHLLPKMFARLYMLKALKIILENSLYLMEIKPISQM